MTDRRTFIQLGIKAAVIISAGKTVKAFASPTIDGLPVKKNIILRFIVVSDGHYGQPGTQYVILHEHMIQLLGEEKKSRGIDFVFVNGDLFHDDIKMIQPAKDTWDKLGIPYHVSHGNHDKIAEAGWEQTFQTKWNYSFEKNDIGFIVLNSADEKGNYICPDLDFTKTQLDKYALKKHLFVFMHITPFNWTKYGFPCPELVTLFTKQGNLKAIFNAHDHEEDGMKENEGKFYFFDSHIASDWGTPYHGYRVVEVLKTGDVLTYQVNPEEKKKVNSNTIALQE